MFAINHASAALLFKKRFPSVHIIWFLISVQLIEILWVFFNYLGIEITKTESSVSYIGDIHLVHMPFSHSLLSTLILSVLAYFILNKIFGDKKLSIAISLAIASHFILDLITHARDLPITYFSILPKIGSTLYNNLPYLAFIIEFSFGIFCWWYFKGNKALLITIILFNLSNFTLFSPDIVGLESIFANRVTLLTTVILFQIIITLLFVGYFSSKKNPTEKINPTKSV